MKKKEVTLPSWLENDCLKRLLQTKAGVIVSNWLMQGTRYMNRHELLYRILTEIMCVLLLTVLLMRMINSYVTILLSFVMIHTLWWLFNGHFFVLMRYVRQQDIDPESFITYVENLHCRVKRKTFLAAAVAFGSLSKGSFNASSDFDLRLIRKNGFVTSVLAFAYCSLERARAFVSTFPLDVYVFDQDEIEDKIDHDEPSIIVSNSGGVFRHSWLSGKIEFCDFSKEFRSKYVER